MGNNRDMKKGASWAAIIVLLFVFFPVGIALMLSKLHREKENYESNGKRTAVVGWVFFGLGIFYFIEGITGNLDASDGSNVVTSVIFMLILLCGGGYAIVRHGREYQKLGKNYSKYIRLINESIDGSIDNIAAESGEPYENACQAIQSLIDGGIIAEGYIDYNTRCFISDIYKRHGGYEQAGSDADTEAASKWVIKCPNCGGINTIAPGHEEVCEFCGSPLNPIR